ncbi:hypothetical protein M0R04_03785 [Candidatus Dojkabacteria bacterium]|jgi:hypothetical protein|nr:hypothetical protein [Candidatus Dojkabacteria bacterium]
MKDIYLTKDIAVKVNIYIADGFLAEDVAVIELGTREGDKRKRKYSEEEFKKEIKDGNVVVAMIREDPIGYAVVQDGKIMDYYIEWIFEDSGLKEILLKEAIK